MSVCGERAGLKAKNEAGGRGGSRKKEPNQTVSLRHVSKSSVMNPHVRREQDGDSFFLMMLQINMVL